MVLFLFYGVLERNRTPNPLIRSQVLYPIELRVHLYKKKVDILPKHSNGGEGEI